jgi:hypothetical protein
MKKRVVYGLPITPINLLSEVGGNSFCISYATRAKLGTQLSQAIDLVADDGILMIDNGAFTAWRSGASNAQGYWDAFLQWAMPIMDQCPQAVVVVPDVIDGTEEENNALMQDFCFGAGLELGVAVPFERCMVVWHMHESLERLAYLIESGFSFIAIGSSGEFAKVGTTEWHARITEAMQYMTDFCANSDGCYVMPWIHMMRAQSQAHLYAFDSSDSCNLAVNHCRYKAEGPGHVARLAGRIAGKIHASCTGAERATIEPPAALTAICQHMRALQQLGTKPLCSQEAI